MAKKDQNQKEKERVQSVLQILKKQAPLTVKQEKFCSNGCVERFLKVKGDHVKKAAKQLRNCLSWRDSIGTDNLIADEFSAELADGLAYVAGHDDESRPIVVFRIKQDYQKIHSHKVFTRLLVFTLEVAIQTMTKNVDKFVLLFDAIHILPHQIRAQLLSAINVHSMSRDSKSLIKSGFFRSGSSFMNMLLATLKIVADYYPSRLHRAFVIDPSSLFSYLWKGLKPFIELSPVTMVVSSLDFDDSTELDGFNYYPRASSLRYSSVPLSTTKLGSCSSSRFTFTVSHHLDSLKPWYLSFADTSASKVGPSHSSLGPTISPLDARSRSFASPIARSAPRGNIGKGFFPSTPMPQKTQKLDYSTIRHPRTPRPSFFQSPASFFQKDCHLSRVEKSRESFLPFVKFYRRPYDEMIYRSKMKPPLGGIISIVSPQLRRRHVSLSQRF